MSDLKPCPFCGESVGEPIDATRSLVFGDFTGRVLGVWRLLHRCRVLGSITLQRPSKEALITAWNTRAEPREVDTLHATLQALRGQAYAATNPANLKNESVEDRCAFYEKTLDEIADQNHEIDILERQYDWYLAEIEKARAAPKVKELEWGAVDADHENITIRIALSVVGEYRIVSQPKASIHRLFLRGGKVLEFNNYSDAKAAAQADYERRILSALTPEAET